MCPDNENYLIYEIKGVIQLLTKFWLKTGENYLQISLLGMFLILTFQDPVSHLLFSQLQHKQLNWFLAFLV